MRISDWSSDVCSSDLDRAHLVQGRQHFAQRQREGIAFGIIALRPSELDGAVYPIADGTRDHVTVRCQVAHAPLDPGHAKAVVLDQVDRHLVDAVDARIPERTSTRMNSRY